MACVLGIRCLICPTLAPTFLQSLQTPPQRISPHIQDDEWIKTTSNPKAFKHLKAVKPSPTDLWRPDLHSRSTKILSSWCWVTNSKMLLRCSLNLSTLLNVSRILWCQPT